MCTPKKSLHLKRNKRKTASHVIVKVLVMFYRKLYVFIQCA